MTVLVALVLAFLFTGLKPIHLKNEAIFTKKAILSAVMDDAGNLNDVEVEDIFGQVEQVVLNHKGEVVSAEKVKELRSMGSDKQGKAEDLDLAKEKKRLDSERLYPLYKYAKSKEETYYITAVRGSGLWDEIWGYIAIEDDFNTIVGVAFDHKAETPGLGAEIKDNPTFPAQFVGEKLYNEKGEYVSVRVQKGGSLDSDKHAVDGISGATITCDGVTDMMYDGLKSYQPYFAQAKEGK